MWSMCRSKRIFALGLLLCLLLSAGCGREETAGEAMLLEGGVESGNVTYLTEEVAPCTIYREGNFPASIGYWSQRDVTAGDFSGATVEEIFVTKNQTVKAGDPIASFDVPYSEAELEGLFADREIANIQYQSGLAGYAAALQQAKADLALATPGTVAYSIAELAVQRAQSAYDYYVGSQNAAIGQIDKAILELQEKLETTVLYAPMDGVVRTVSTALHAGDMVFADTVICTIYDPEDTYISVTSDQILPFRTGAAVTVSSRYYQDGAPFAAVVVSAPDAVGLAEGTAILQIADETARQGIVDAGGSCFATLRAEVQDVLAVPADAIYREDHDSYVLLLQNGSPVKRYVTVGLGHTRVSDGASVVQILDGLQVGDVVIVG